MAGLKVGVLVSGRGSNLQALIDACAAPGFPAKIVLVVSNQADAHGLARAKAAGIATRVIEHGGFADRTQFDAAIDGALREAEVGFVALAGFMRILSADFVESWRDRIVNIHPSLLPAFKGLQVHERVIEAGVRFSGCTVHFVRPATDDGPIIIQAAVPVLSGDDAASLAARVLEAEHKIYPEALKLIALDRVQVRGSRALVAGAKGPGPAQINPRPSGEAACGG